MPHSILWAQRCAPEQVTLHSTHRHRLFKKEKTKSFANFVAQGLAICVWILSMRHLSRLKTIVAQKYFRNNKKVKKYRKVREFLIYYERLCVRSESAKVLLMTSELALSEEVALYGFKKISDIHCQGLDKPFKGIDGEIFSPRSTLEMYVRCRPAISARASCESPFASRCFLMLRSMQK